MRVQVAALTALALLLPGEPPQAAAPLRQIPTVLRAHSTWSSGDQTLDQLTTRARRPYEEASLDWARCAERLFVPKHWLKLGRLRAPRYSAQGMVDSLARFYRGLIASNGICD